MLTLGNMQPVHRAAAAAVVVVSCRTAAGMPVWAASLMSQVSVRLFPWLVDSVICESLGCLGGFMAFMHRHPRSHDQRRTTAVGQRPQQQPFPGYSQLHARPGGCDM
jgi:hypothetical protein